MNDLIRHFTNYLKETLGVTVNPQYWDGYRSLPVFMHGLYDFYTVRILDEPCLLLVSRGDDGTTPATIRKHYDIVHRKWSGPVIVVKQAIASNSRQRLVEFKVPFVVPGNQLYLPDMGLDMREHFRQIREMGRSFSPSTQVVMLHVLLCKDCGSLTSTYLGCMLSYTPMTIKRAFDEIAQVKIGVLSKRGRERELRFQKTGRDLWEAALPFLRDPVQKQITAAFPPDAIAGFDAGLTALSCYSMISAPMQPTLAVSSDAWKTARQDPRVQEVAYDDEGTHRIEIWRYNPALLSSGPTVDKLSLFLSMRATADERVEAALDEMMENLQW
ncbi:MAG: hypothetical protein ACYC27_12350 [Armatimonadota bacterium]